MQNLKKILKYGKYKKENLNSGEISFKNLAAIPDSEEKKLTIDLPFSLLPIFYYKGVNAFIKFLSNVIKINNFENIVFCKEKIFEALDIMKDYNYTKEEKNKPEEMVNSQITIKNIIDLKPNTLNRNNSYLKNNNFIFFWTTNIYTYATTIKLPCIHVSILDNKIDINHFIV